MPRITKLGCEISGRGYKNPLLACINAFDARTEGGKKFLADGSGKFGDFVQLQTRAYQGHPIPDVDVVANARDIDH